MEKKLRYKSGRKLRRISFKIILTMKLSVLLMTVACVQVSASAISQTISLSVEKAPMEQVIKMIKKRSGYQFIYSDEVLKRARPVTMNIFAGTLVQVLEECFSNQPLTYALVDKTIVVKPKEPEPVKEQQPIEIQKLEVKGKVMDEKGEALPGVSIVVKGTQQGTVTNAEGNFSLDVPDDKTILVFSFVGYLSQEVNAGNGLSINIKLKVDDKALDEVVVVGYGTQKKVSLTASVSQIKGDELTRRPVSNVQQSLQGLAPGVTVMDLGGAPGRSEATIRVRGITTFNTNASSGTYGGFDLSKNSALTLVDGIEQRLTDLNPEDIESISVLKDAASTAIYGSRATNGVILVTTKRAKVNKVSTTYSTYYAIQQSINKPQMMDLEPYMRLQQAAHNNAGIPLPTKFTDESIQTWVNATDREKYPLPNTWFQTVLKAAPQQNHTLAVAGGNDVIRTRLSARYMNQAGIAPNYKDKLGEVKLSTDFKASNKITFGVDINYRNNFSVIPTVEPWQNLLHGSLWGYPKYADGTYGLGAQQGNNPLMFAEIGGLSKLTNEQTVINLKGEWEIINGLKFLSQFAGRINNQNSKNFTNAYTNLDKNTGFIKTVTPNNLTEIRNTLRETTWIDMLTYEKSFGKHDMKLLGGFSEIENSQTFLTTYRQGFYNNDITSISQGTNDGTKNNSGNDAAFALRSFFGRVNYSYADKYLLEVNGRYDGSSKFTGKKQYGFFPSVSAGWRVSQESFFERLSPIISDLKIRASWGKQGNQSVNLYSYFSSLNLANYAFGGASAPGYRQTTLANPDLGWETTTQTDIGADLSFLKGRLTLTADYYNKLTNDILLNLAIPATIGLAAPSQNAGSVQNKGFELAIGYREASGPKGFRYSINTNFSINDNKVVDLKGTGPYIVGQGESYPQYIVAAGLPINSLWGYKTDGLFQTQDQVNSYPTRYPNSKPGDVKYLDLNEDGKIDANDMTTLGNTFPKYTFGIQGDIGYKAFDINVLFQGVAGISTRLGGALSDNGNYEAFTHKILTDNYWTPENPNAEFPRPLKRDPRNGLTSDRNVIDGSYLRMKNIQLGYTFPSEIIQKIKISHLRVYVSATNILVFSKLKRWNIDPEVEPGVAVYYPQTSAYTVGLNVQF